MKVLVLATNYTNLEGTVASHFIHNRNLVYQREGIDVTVLSFATKNNYVLEGIQVISLNNYKTCNRSYDVLISHAPNLRNHFIFLKKEKHKFSRIYYFFHGHEVLLTSKVYPKPYSYMGGGNTLKKSVIDVYDNVKVRVWKKYFSKIEKDEYLVFVSEWMKNRFNEYVDVRDPQINQQSYVINNCIGEAFVEHQYDGDLNKKIDFVTIRNILDLSKYAIDKVLEIACDHPEFSFLIVGKGDFFSHHEKPSNLKWIDRNLNHSEIIYLLNMSKYALLPTRADAQGVMACEMASFGIPVITSNIEINREILDGFENVVLIDNNEEVNLNEIVPYIEASTIKNRKFYPENTVYKEIELIKGAM